MGVPFMKDINRVRIIYGVQRVTVDKYVLEKKTQCVNETRKSCPTRNSMDISRQTTA